MSEFKTIIGLEIHAQMNTKSKMFCFCDNESQGKEPNTVVCPICLGMPGTLPVANEQAIKKAIKIGKALGSVIPEISKFDRKHYYYPDLPKGYQISQYDMPLCKGGSVEFELDGEKISVKLNRVHLEEDAGKLIHDSTTQSTIVDLNRAGTPLVEIVTEPVIQRPEHAKAFMQTLQKILRQLDVSSADMEKGHMRCDANISVQKDGVLSKIIEVKNLNSFRFVQKALEHEEKRLTENFDDNIGPGKQTRGFDSKTSRTYAQRVKEEASDYRYFPEPDIPLINTKELAIEGSEFELPEDFKRRIIETYNLSPQIAGKIASDKTLSEKFKSISNLDGVNISRIANWMVNEINNLSGEQLIEISALIDNSKINNEQAKHILRSEEPNLEISKIASGSNSQVDIDAVVDSIISEHSDEKMKYKSGKTQLIGFFVGLAMKETRGSVNPQQIMEVFKKKLEE